MRTVCSLVLFLSVFCAQAQVRTATLAWDYSVPAGDSITNYVFYLRASANATNALPWPVVNQVYGMTSVQVPISGSLQFFYVTASNLVSNPTNYWCESDPSNTVRWQLTPGGQLRIIGK